MSQGTAWVLRKGSPSHPPLLPESSTIRNRRAAPTRGGDGRGLRSHAPNQGTEQGQGCHRPAQALEVQSVRPCGVAVRCGRAGAGSPGSSSSQHRAGFPPSPPRRVTPCLMFFDRSASTRVCRRRKPKLKGNRDRSLRPPPPVLRFPLPAEG